MTTRGDDDTFGQYLMVEELRRDEGEVLHAYQDHLGWWTIGVGRMIDHRRGGGITREESAYLLANDIKRVAQVYDRDIPWWRRMGPVRQRALLNMGFQIGPAGVTGASRTMNLLRQAVDEDTPEAWGRLGSMLRSWRWAKEQTPARARRVISQLVTGGLPNGR